MHFLNMLTCSLIHVLNISTETRPIRISFSPSQSGLLASLSNDSSCISLYNIKETTNKLRRFSKTILLNRDLPSDDVENLDHLNNGFGGDGGMTTMKSSYIMGGSGFVDYSTFEKSGRSEEHTS